MKDKWIEKEYDIHRHFITCSCADLGHLLIFEKFRFSEEDNYEISVYISDDPNMTLRRRLVQAFRLVFQKKYNYISDDILIDKNNVSELQEWIDSIKDAKQKETKPFHHCVVCDSTNLITFYDSERIGTELEKYRYKCLNCGVEFEISDVVTENKKEVDFENPKTVEELFHKPNTTFIVG
jgi:hypothetical protein